MRVDGRRAIAEAVATAILVLVGPGALAVAASTGAFEHTGVAVAFGLVIVHEGLEGVRGETHESVRCACE